MYVLSKSVRVSLRANFLLKTLIYFKLLLIWDLKHKAGSIRTPEGFQIVHNKMFLKIPNDLLI